MRGTYKFSRRDSVGTRLCPWSTAAIPCLYPQQAPTWRGRLYGSVLRESRVTPTTHLPSDIRVACLRMQRGLLYAMDCEHWAHQAGVSWSPGCQLPCLSYLSYLALLFKMFFIVMPDADTLGSSTALRHWVTQ